jgi:hypothetical protein
MHRARLPCAARYVIGMHPCRMSPILPSVLVLLALGGLALTATGCGKDREEAPFSAAADKDEDPDMQKLKRDVADLTKCKDPDDLTADARYEEVKERLIQRGSAIEPQLIEALLGSEDWGIRLGTVEVLQAIGTKRSVAPLIQVLDDRQPLVALKADYTLREMTKHREIPPAGEPTGANGLPPVPTRDSKDLALDAEQKLWADWHAQHKDKLKEAWSAWWEKNKDSVKVE